MKMKQQKGLKRARKVLKRKRKKERKIALNVVKGKS